MKQMDKIVKEWLNAFLIAAVITIIIYFVIWPIRISGSSMENTLSDGEYILISRAVLWVSPLKYNELAVIRYEENGKTEKMVKRVIGLEGDHIVIKGGQVIKNGEILEEAYVKGDTLHEIDIHIPKDCFFVLGDNRKVSKDSRHIGCIQKESIISKVIKTP